MAKKKSTAQSVKSAAGSIKLTMKAKLILWVFVSVILAVSLIFSWRIDSFLSKRNDGFTGNVSAEVLRQGDLKVHFVDVGQGDCTIAELPDGKIIIIDGGENKTDVAAAIKDYIKSNLPSSFKYFDYAVLTHQDSDHCGSLDDILNEYPARISYRPNVISNNGSFSDPALALLTDGNVSDNYKFYNNVTATNEVTKKDTVAYKNCIQAMYNPTAQTDFTPEVIISDGRRSNRPAGKSSIDIVTNGEKAYSIRFYAPLSYTYSDSNDYSTILIIEYQNRKILLSGDAEKTSEAEFISTYGNENFNVDAVKLGHHGSKTSSSEAFLNLVTGSTPNQSVVTIISCGEGNKYKHPHTQVLDRLKELSFDENKILRTDTNGSILIAVINTENGYILGYTAGYTTLQAPIKWWHIVVVLEIGAVVLIFMVIKTKKVKKTKISASSSKTGGGTKNSGGNENAKSNTSVKTRVSSGAKPNTKSGAAVKKTTAKSASKDDPPDSARPEI